jgi:hypothetical protein
LKIDRGQVFEIEHLYDRNINAAPILPADYAASSIR